MYQSLLHTLPDLLLGNRPRRFTFPYNYQPHPWAELASVEVMEEVRGYMTSHPESELHRLGKMFGVLVVETPAEEIGYLRAFSAMLDGTYHHPGYVEPVFDISRPDGFFKQEEAAISAINRLILTSDSEEQALLKRERKSRSQALQRWMFSQYQMLNAKGETRNLLEIFRSEKPILTEEDYFSGRQPVGEPLPPSGAGECCAPKLLQTAYLQGLRPLCMAEFWMGASPKNELRIEGAYYGACLGKCKPILTHMLQGLSLEEDPILRSSKHLADASTILYADDAIVVVNKPAGLLTIPGSDGAYSLSEHIQSIYGASFAPVHRLDQDTSGIVVFAQAGQAYTALQKQFVQHSIRKRYEAVLQPLTNDTIPTEGEIRLPLLRNPFDRPRQMVDPQHGKPAATAYAIKERLPNGTILVDLYPLTGRTHQLRVHCAHPQGLNAPILGDRLYGKGQSAERLMLHAAEIQFTHPLTGQAMHFICNNLLENAK